MEYKVGDAVYIKSVENKPDDYKECLFQCGIVRKVFSVKRDIYYSVEMYNGNKNKWDNNGYFYFEEEELENYNNLITTNAVNQICVGTIKSENIAFEQKSEGEIKMDIYHIKEKALDIIRSYNKYAMNEIHIQKEKRIDEIIKTSEINKILEKHQEEIKNEIFNLVGKKAEEKLSDSYDINEIRNLFFCVKTKEEEEEINEIEKHYSSIEEVVNDVLTRIMDSLDLCETREQIMDLLRTTGFVYDNGVVTEHEYVGIIDKYL